MKNINITVMDVEFPYDVPVDSTEFDKLAKRVGACNDEATKNVLYRGTFAEIRDIVLNGADAVVVDGKEVLPAIKGLEELSGIARKTKKIKTGKEQKEVEVYDETEDDYFGRVAATQKKERKDYLPMFITAAKYAPFDPSVRERKPAGPKKLAEKFKTIATEFLSGKKSLDKLNVALQKSISKTFTKTGDTEKDTLALGWLCKEYADAQDVFAKVG